ncbi:MAG TPA: LysE family transporter, partial [Bacteroidia bacterium]|nr:LysE family transporter [Bacteroidia bacterium]
IQTSIRYGHKAGIEMALGIFFSDLTYLLLAFFGLSDWLADVKYALPVGITGGVLLIGYGIVQVFKKGVVQNVDGDGSMEIKRPTFGAFTLKGYIMNLLNPFVLFLWIAAIGLASTKLDHDTFKIVIFFTATLATVLTTDILKALGAAKIKSYLNPNMIHKVNILAGIILIICGVVLIVKVFVEHPWSAPPEIPVIPS